MAGSHQVSGWCLKEKLEESHSFAGGGGGGEGVRYIQTKRYIHYPQLQTLDECGNAKPRAAPSASDAHKRTCSQGNSSVGGLQPFGGTLLRTAVGLKTRQSASSFRGVPQAKARHPRSVRIPQNSVGRFGTVTTEGVSSAVGGLALKSKNAANRCTACRRGAIRPSFALSIASYG